MRARGFLFLISALLWCSLTGHAATVLVSWQAVTTNVDGSALTDLSWYHISYGTEPGVYGAPLNAGLSTEILVSGLIPGTTYWFTSTAWDTSGNESTQAIPISYTVPLPPDDTIPPIVIQSSVPDGAINVDPTRTITVQCSEAMLSSTINAITVQLRDAGGTLVAASVTYTSETNTVSLDPSTILALNSTYTLTLNGLTDQAGNALAPVSMRFTTAPTHPSSLVAAYSFNAGSGGTVADSSGYHHHGTRSGTTWTNSGKYGKALSFDGINDRVDIPDAPALRLKTGMTLMAWIYPMSGSGARDILIKEGASVDLYNLYARNWRGRPEINAFINGSNRVAEGSALKTARWIHLAGTYDGAALRLYHDGVQVAQQAQTGPIVTSTGWLRIGGNALWGEWFKGRIDEVRIFNRALSIGEIQTARITPVP